MADTVHCFNHYGETCIAEFIEKKIVNSYSFFLECSRYWNSLQRQTVNLLCAPPQTSSFNIHKICFWSRTALATGQSDITSKELHLSIYNRDYLVWPKFGIRLNKTV